MSIGSWYLHLYAPDKRGGHSPYPTYLHAGQKQRARRLAREWRSKGYKVEITMHPGRKRHFGKGAYERLKSKHKRRETKYWAGRDPRRGKRKAKKGYPIKRCKRGVVTQSIVFSKKRWSAARAKAWLKKHKFKTASRKGELRYRQVSPKSVKIVGGKEIKPGVRLVLGCPVRGGKSKRSKKSKKSRDPHEYGVGLHVGARVELHPGTDRWMRGDRYGEIISQGRSAPKVWYVKMDRSGKTVKVYATRLRKV